MKIESVLGGRISLSATLPPYNIAIYSAYYIHFDIGAYRRNYSAPYSRPGLLDTSITKVHAEFYED